jgi:hypothetical protein
MSSCTPKSRWNAGCMRGSPQPSRQLSGLPDEAAGELLRLAGQDPQSPIMMAEVRHLGGMFAQDPPHGSAIGRCEAPYLLELLGLAITPEADEAVRRNQHDISAALARGPPG